MKYILPIIVAIVCLYAVVKILKLILLKNKKPVELPCYAMEFEPISPEEQTEYDIKKAYEADGYYNINDYTEEEWVELYAEKERKREEEEERDRKEALYLKMEYEEYLRYLEEQKEEECRKLREEQEKQREEDERMQEELRLAEEREKEYKRWYRDIDTGYQNYNDDDYYY